MEPTIEENSGKWIILIVTFAVHVLILVFQPPGVVCDQPMSPCAGGDTLHTHQASGDPCSVLDIVNVE